MMNVIKSVAPSAAIKDKCHDTRPIRVCVSIQRDGAMSRIFEEDQRKLFKKNAGDRKQAIKQLTAAVEAAVESLPPPAEAPPPAEEGAGESKVVSS